MARKEPNPKFPATILVDSREQCPYTFDSILADSEFGGGWWQVKTTRLALPSGDYSLDGYASKIATERKSMADLFGTIGNGRERFTRELERLGAMNFAAIVVEAEWSQVIETPPARTELSPKTVYRSVLAWQQRFPRVHWWFLPDRDLAELTTFRIFERFLKEQQEINFRKPKV